VRRPPAERGSPLRQGLRFAIRPMAFNLGAQRRHGDVWTIALPTRRDGFVVTCHPDHLESLLKADPADAPSLTGESPLRPILGPNSVLTSVGERHLRQRRLLLPPFHGEAVARYVEMISEVTEREVARWRPGTPLALAPRMQAITLEVIMRGIFGAAGEGSAARRRDSPEERLRHAIRRFLAMTTHPLFRVAEMRNAGHAEARGILRWMLDVGDRHMYAVIAARRREQALEGSGRTDVLTLLLAARDEEGQPLTDQELRDELMSLLLAGHETTANALAWTIERLLRTPEAYAALREEVRSGPGGERARARIDATIHEGMRSRPVIPMIVRLVRRPWRLGEYVIEAGTPVAVSIIAMHHRPDVYPEPHRFAPERFLDERAAFVKPGTYTWIPFGGGIRRCLGATLAMAEQRVVLEAVARRLDLVAPDLAPERPRMRNVTMIPGRGCEVIVAGRHT
jgi:cytochrome P450